MVKIKKYEIKYKTVAFIEKAISYTFELPNSSEEKAFMEKHEKNVNEIVKKFPRLDYDPITYYQFCCNIFSKYTEQEKSWIWAVDDDMSKDNTEIMWKELKIAADKTVGFYYTSNFFYRIKIFFYQTNFFIKTRADLIIHLINKKLGIKDKNSSSNSQDLVN